MNRIKYGKKVINYWLQFASTIILNSQKNEVVAMRSFDNPGSVIADAISDLYSTMQRNQEALEQSKRSLEREEQDAKRRLDEASRNATRSKIRIDLETEAKEKKRERIEALKDEKHRLVNDLLADKRAAVERFLTETELLDMETINNFDNNQKLEEIAKNQAALQIKLTADTNVIANQQNAIEAKYSIKIKAIEKEKIIISEEVIEALAQLEEKRQKEDKLRKRLIKKIDTLKTTENENPRMLALLTGFDREVRALPIDHAVTDLILTFALTKYVEINAARTENLPYSQKTPFVAILENLVSRECVDECKTVGLDIFKRNHMLIELDHHIKRVSESTYGCDADRTNKLNMLNQLKNDLSFINSKGLPDKLEKFKADNWEIITKQRRTGIFSLFNPSKTSTQVFIEKYIDAYRI